MEEARETISLRDTDCVFVWRDGRVVWEDFDVENELLSYLVSNTTIPCHLYVVRELLKEMQGNIGHFSKYCTRLRRIKQSIKNVERLNDHLPLGMALYRNYLAVCLNLDDRDDLPRDLVEWAILDREGEGIIISDSAIAANPKWDGDLLDKLFVNAFPPIVTEALINNPSTSQKTFERILSHSNTRGNLLINSLSVWQKRWPEMQIKEAVFDQLFSRLRRNEHFVLTQLNLSPKSQIIFCQLCHSDDRIRMTQNPYLADETKIFLSTDENHEVLLALGESDALPKIARKNLIEAGMLVEGLAL